MQDLQVSSFVCGVLRVLVSVGEGNIRECNLSAVSTHGTQVTASIEYFDQSRLEINLLMDVSLGFVTWTSYSFHYMNSESRTIFRYDNAEHHPELPTFPDHKHEGLGETVTSSNQPSARAIRDEIEAHLYSDKGM